MPETLTQKKSRAGKAGAAAVMKKYGLEYFRINGTRGGRPKSPALEDIKQPQPLENEIKGGMDTARIRSLSKLKRLWFKQKSTAGNQIKEAGSVISTAPPKE